MNFNAKVVIKKCAHESHAGLLTFPEVLGRLMTVGVKSYFADYRNQSTTYYLSSNETYVVPMTVPSIEIPLHLIKIALFQPFVGLKVIWLDILTFLS